MKMALLFSTCLFEHIIRSIRIHQTYNILYIYIELQDRSSSKKLSPVASTKSSVHFKPYHRMNISGQV